MKNIKDILLNKSDTIFSAINALNKGSLRIVLVTDKNDVLLGTVTDGDIRRSIINQIAMDEPIHKIMSSNPSFVHKGENRNKILSLMRERDIIHMPVVDNKMRVVGIETLDHVLSVKQFDNPVLIMAGGFGKRLGGLTKDIPKPLIRVGEKPILEIILNQFINHGFHNFHISTHYLSEAIKDYFGNGNKWGVSIKYIHEEQPLGTAGVLSLLPKNFSEHPMILMNGDLLTKINFEDLLIFHNSHKADATMCVREYDIKIPYGVVNSKGNKLISIAEKPIEKFFVNAGVYVLNPSVINRIEGKQNIDMPALLQDSIKKGMKVNTLPLHEYWLDIGKIEHLHQAQEDFQDLFYD